MIQQAPLVTTGSGAPVGLLCRSTVTWTECVAAMALEDGHVLPISTGLIPTNSALKHGEKSHLQRGRVEGQVQDVNQNISTLTALNTPVYVAE